MPSVELRVASASIPAASHDWKKIARRFHTTKDDARAQLGTLVFDDLETGRLILAAEYLSSQVRDKLRHAGQAAEDAPRFAVNVTEPGRRQPAAPVTPPGHPAPPHQARPPGRRSAGDSLPRRGRPPEMTALAALIRDFAALLHQLGDLHQPR
jgi:hypothetical protein